MKIIQTNVSFNYIFIHQHQQNKINRKMKFVQRNQMYETRFSQSFNNMPAKNKFFQTSKTSLNKTQQRLPQLNRSFSSSTAKNAKQKVQGLDEKVQDLTKKVLDLRLQTRESRRFTNFLKEDLGDRELQDKCQNLMLKINTLDKFAKLVRKSNDQRTQLLKNDCQKLHDSSIKLQDLMDNLLKRADNIEHTMGIYSAKQKHKF